MNNEHLMNKEVESFHQNHSEIFDLNDYGFNEVDNRWEGIFEFNEIQDFIRMRSEIEELNKQLSEKYNVEVIFFYTLLEVKGLDYWDKDGVLNGDASIIWGEINQFKQD